MNDANPPNIFTPVAPGDVAAPIDVDMEEFFPYASFSQAMVGVNSHVTQSGCIPDECPQGTDFPGQDFILNDAMEVPGPSGLSPGNQAVEDACAMLDGDGPSQWPPIVASLDMMSAGIATDASSVLMDSDIDDDDMSAYQAGQDAGCRDDKLGIGAFSRVNHSEIEKRRRDKMNQYITQLSAMIPMCSAINRKCDKLTVLRMTVQHMKTLRAENSHTEMSHKPSFLSDEEIKHLIMKSAQGYLLVVSCDRGRILYTSESVTSVLNLTRSELIGQNLFDFVHPKDITKVKEQLQSSDIAPRERLIDAKTMMPVKAELPEKASRMCSGSRRAFFCQMKMGMLNASEPLKERGHKNVKKKSDNKSFIGVQCTGFIKSWPKSKVYLEQAEQDADSESCYLSCLVAVCLPVPTPTNTPVPPENPRIRVRPLEFNTRQSVDFNLTYCDHRVTSAVGYLPQELLGLSLFYYCHPQDLMMLKMAQKNLLQHRSVKVETRPWRFKAKDNSYVCVRSFAQTFVNPWTKEVEYIVSKNELCPYPNTHEVSSSGQAVDSPQRASSSRGSSPIDNKAPGTFQYSGLDANTGPRIDVFKREDCSPSTTDAALLHGQSSNNMGDVSPGTCPSSSSSVAATRRSVSQESEIKTLMPPPTSYPATSHPARKRPRSASGDSFHDTAYGSPSVGLFDYQQSDSTTSGSDDAAMAMVMSLLEADAGLGGPVDFNDLPWPL